MLYYLLTMRILGIDPGYDRLGIAILEKTSPKETVVFSECFKTSKTLPHAERLHLVAEKIRAMIIEYKPDAIAIEKLFFTTNKKTALAVGEARGVILAACAQSGMAVAEYAPNQIKLAVTGYGNADKTAVIKLVPKLVFMVKEVLQDDEMDAIAVAITHSCNVGYPQQKR